MKRHLEEHLLFSDAFFQLAIHYQNVLGAPCQNLDSQRVVLFFFTLRKVLKFHDRGALIGDWAENGNL